MYAAVDLGSNSFRLHIGEPIAGQMHIVRTARDPIRLAAGLGPDGALTVEAMETAVRSLRDFSAILRQYRLDAVRVVATNTMRVATNAEALLPRLEAAVGYPIEVISGEEEGRLIYMGVSAALAKPGEQRLVIDVGGGSTEVIAGRGDEIQLVDSFSTGTHPQSAVYFPGGVIGAAAFDAAVNAARARFEDAADQYRAHGWQAVYGSSGTIRAIHEVISRNRLGDGAMSFDSLLALRDKLVAAGHADAFDLPGIKRERVIVMAGGLSVLIGAMQEFGVRAMTAINAGLRLGVLSDFELRAHRSDRRDSAVQDCMRRFGVDQERARRTASIARQLFNRLGAGDDSLCRYLLWSCMLHEVGQAVSHTGAHKHAAYIVEHADLPGFTNREQRLMSSIVLAQKGNLRKVREALGAPDQARAILAMRLAAVFMHARVDGDVDALRLRMKNRIEIDTPRGWLGQHPTVAAWFEKEAVAWGEVGIGFQLGQV
ncbi:exopolyphosphatase [Massilia sp. WF1]|uniref:Ppx/GppA phosphatase family protein n=1 Tax=unclassified Massilia TaxID=2609279 RepID=UPI00064B02B5|nr:MULTISPECIES: Ppx/GppA phosphatase family protein [unclassified Massilia]ALK96848.1 exopolyphosphatase [Massilia sp. WG5]KLU38191.1 exopolyphosphatase [Massilia sp. WF1]